MFARRANSPRAWTIRPRARAWRRSTAQRPVKSRRSESFARRTWYQKGSLLKVVATKWNAKIERFFDGMIRRPQQRDLGDGSGWDCGVLEWRTAATNSCGKAREAREEQAWLLNITRDRPGWA